MSIRKIFGLPGGGSGRRDRVKDLTHVVRGGAFRVQDFSPKARYQATVRGKVFPFNKTVMHQSWERVMDGHIQASLTLCGISGNPNRLTRSQLKKVNARLGAIDPYLSTHLKEALRNEREALTQAVRQQGVPKGAEPIWSEMPSSVLTIRRNCWALFAQWKILKAERALLAAFKIV